MDKIKASFFSICLLALWTAVPAPRTFDAPEKIKIMTTVFPLMEFAKAVTGSRGEVNLLIPPGAEVHSWQPRASDIVNLSRADLLISVGANLEPWLHGLLKSVANPGLKNLEASGGLELIQGSGEEPSESTDPHVWLDFANDQKIVDRISELCAQLSPRDEPIFRENASKYKQRLQTLDNEYAKSLASCSQRSFVCGGHAAFGYLAKRYSLRQISLYGLSPDAEPTPRQLAEVMDFVKENRIKVIFFETAVSNKLAKMIATDVGGQILLLNPCHNLSREQMVSGLTFFDIMEENLRNLKKGLGCD
jgi:zinc transport system substrate-binding protein